MANKSITRFLLTFPQTPTPGTTDALLTKQARDFSLSVAAPSDTSRTLTVTLTETTDDDIARYLGDLSSSSQFKTPRTGVLTLFGTNDAIIESIPLNSLTGVSAQLVFTAGYSVVTYRCVYTFLI